MNLEEHQQTSESKKYMPSDRRSQQRRKPKCEGYIPFTKMQGLGNDFVVINAMAHDFSLSTESIQKIADRHFGVGCDQILILNLPRIKEQNIDFTYQIFNADGSEAGQCGNGVRCLAKFVTEHGLTQKKDLCFATKSCKTLTHLEKNGQITATTDKPIFDPKNIPFVAKKEALRYNLALENHGEIEIGAVSVGNPHAIVLVEGDFTDHLKTLGPLISKNKHFPDGVNVNFMRIINRKKIELRVYERGSGETLACGSGACASVVIGKLWGLLDSTVMVKLAGGDLLIKWKDSNSIQITGPAEQVFTGEITLTR
jgi:diaminopimelate epimerase